MGSARHDYQLLVAAFECLKGVFAEIPGVGLFPGNDHHGALDLAAPLEEGQVDERQGESLIPAPHGVHGPGMEAPLGLIVGRVLLDEFRRVRFQFLRLQVGAGPGKRIVLIVFRPLGVHGFQLLMPHWPAPGSYRTW